MHRFFIDPADIDGAKAVLSGEEAHHLRKVLRLSPGDQVELYDGKGTVYQAGIEAIESEVHLVITSQQAITAESPSLCIGQGLLKGKKMDLLLQKACELGVTTLAPFSSDHCAVQPPKSSKISRWHKIILESCKQCGRPLPLDLEDTRSFEELLAGADRFDTKLIFWEKEDQRHLTHIPALADTGSIIALIGPEGGFSKEEVKTACSAGFITVSLGKRTLRAETAAISVITLLQYLSGNL